MELEGKVAIVTGGVAGIGLAIVKQLLHNKSKVCICDINSAEGEVLLEHLKAEYGDEQVMFKKCDVTDSASFEDVFQETIRSFKRVDILFNNAGVVSENDGKWRRMIAINLTSVIDGTYLAFKYMNKYNGGHGGVVINTTSAAGVLMMEHFPVYGATKHGAKAFSQTVGQTSVEMYGVRVNAFGPSYTDTALAASFFTQGPLYNTPNNANEKMSIGMEALKPFLRPDDVARYALRLITEPGSGRMMMIMRGHVSEVPPMMDPPELPALYDD